MKNTRLLSLLLSLSLAISTFTFGGLAASIGKVSGDANSDGIVDANDLLLVRKYIANYDFDTMSATISISSNADIDGNGTVDVKDLILLRRGLANDGFDENDVFTIKSSADVDLLLDGAMVFKFGSSYAYVNGARVDMGDSTPFYEKGGYFPADFIEQNGLGTVSDSNVKIKDGKRYVSATVFTLEGKQVYFFSADSYILITDTQWKLSTNSLLSELERKVGNLLSLGVIYSAQMAGNRPVIFETDEMLAESKAQAALRVEPWLTSWQNVLKKANASLTEGPAPYVGESATEYRLAACSDFINARSLALAYYNTGDSAYLARALEYLMAYANEDIMLGTDKYLDYSASTKDGKADIGLNIATPLTTFCDVYSLIYPYISAADRATLRNWISAEAALIKKGHQYWMDNGYYSGQTGNNHLSSHLMGLICAAYALEDDELLAFVISSEQNESNLLDMLDRAILMEGDTVYSADPQKTFTVGEVYDRYRVVDTTPNGFGYAMYHLKFLTYSAFVMSNNGLDLFSYVGTNGENLLLPYKTYAEYLIANDNTLNGGYYAGNSLNRESCYTLYLMANRVYDDETIDAVISALEADGVVPGDNEQFGRSGGYILGK